ncbi:MAG: hypothetical protein CMQ24_07745 [Gammaproteobacteria bacterium]|nr:hypothetical protein [Gammaproteobacteria bacterium]
MNARYTRPLEAPPAFEPLETFRFPLRLGTGLTWLLFAIIFVLATTSLKVPAFYIRSLFLWVVGAGLFTQYSFVVIEYTSRGYQEVPKLSGSMMFWNNNMRMWQVITIVLTALLLGALVTDEWSRIVYLVVLSAMLPVAISGVVLGGSLIIALNPLTWFSTVRRFGINRASITFAVLQAALMFTTTTLVAQFEQIDGFHLLWIVPLVVLLAIVTVRSLGVLLNSRSAELGLLVNQSSERHEQALLEHERLVVHDFISGLYPLARADKLGEAWTRLSNNLARDDWARALLALDHLRTWEDQRLALRLALELIERHVHASEMAAAWSHYDYVHRATAGDVKLLSGRAALALGRTAAGLDQTQQAADGLRHFTADFPNHPGEDDALKLRLKLALVDRDIDVGDIHHDLRGHRDLIVDPEARELIRRVRRMQGRGTSPS